MDAPVKQQNGQLICLKYKHNEPVILVVMDDQVPFVDKFLCAKCLQIHRCVTKMTPINAAIDIIRESIQAKYTQQKDEIDQSLNFLDEFLQMINQFRIQIITQLDETLNITKLWISEIKNIKNKDDLTNLIEEFQKYSLGKQIKNQEPEIVQINKSYYQRYTNVVQQLFDSNVYKNLYNAYQKIKEICSTKKQNLVETQMVSSLATEASWALAFNYDDTILIAGCNQVIKVWQFNNGKISLQSELVGHTNNVSALVFSKKTNWFASGSWDKTIRGWKSNQKNEWTCSKPQEVHTCEIMCLILNKKEDQLISCSCDSHIITWKVDINKNEIKQSYTLQNKHCQSVFCITMNDTETALVSCGQDQQIILWMQDKNRKWIYKHHINCIDYGYRVCFIQNNQFIWQQCQKGITHILEISDGQIVSLPKFSIELNKETKDNWLFPTILNKKKQIIVQRHNQYVYLLKQESDGKLKILQQPIDCVNQDNYGCISNNGEYVVIWSFGTSQCRVYRLKYE